MVLPTPAANEPPCDVLSMVIPVITSGWGVFFGASSVGGGGASDGGSGVGVGGGVRRASLGARATFIGTGSIGLGGAGGSGALAGTSITWNSSGVCGESLG